MVYFVAWVARAWYLVFTAMKYVLEQLIRLLRFRKHSNP